MLTALIILVAYLLLSALFRWAYKPRKNYTPPYPPGSGKSMAAPKNIFDLMYPRLEDDKTEKE